MNEQTHSIVWEECLGIIGNILDSQQFSTWFKPMKSVSLQDSALTVEVPSHFFCEYIEAHYLDLLRKTLKRVLGPDAKLYYQVKVIAPKTMMKIPMAESVVPTNAAISIPSVPSTEGPGAFVIPGITPKLRINPQLNPVFSFSNLVEGPCNKLGITAGKNIAGAPGKTSFNPLFIFGDPGLGKTHIAQAIGLSIKENFPEQTVLYVPANRFKTQFMKAYSAKTQFTDFLAFYQRIDVLIIDDIQELSSPGIQSAVFHIFNHLHQNNKQLIFTSDRPQVELQNFEQRLLNRLKWGLSVELTAPGYETRLAMLKARCLREGVSIEDDILEFLASKITTNFRELAGALISLIAQTTFLSQEATLEMAEHITENIVDDSATELNIENVQKVVCDYFNITREEMLSPSRKRQIVQARQIAMYLSRNLTKSSLSTIGEQIGGKDHATVLHACNTVADLMSIDRLFKQYVTDIQKALTTTN